MKRILYLILIIFLILICLKACIRQDIPDEKNYKQNVVKTDEQFTFPSNPINIVLNGREYLQTQSTVGKYGGELINSTIGEGPKTFNPFNSKDSTSSSMAGLMSSFLSSVFSISQTFIHPS